MYAKRRKPCFVLSLVSFAVLIACLAACSSKQLYRAGQDMQREQCRAGPPAEYERCMENADLDYETFQEARNTDSDQ